MSDPNPPAPPPTPGAHQFAPVLEPPRRKLQAVIRARRDALRKPQASPPTK